uniref:Uncharacterized protein n=1 Tax=Siphoviridae sp. cto3L1 TaxID=2827942 RepID=A0A8S5SRD0_9CAUD|nr:MAG TPA: hypothetical protein [Siphoviridae sp. cto3L1]DAO53243.1 MAG TPA: hypothetical protein [Caudoviricetes sp.]
MRHLPLNHLTTIYLQSMQKCLYIMKEFVYKVRSNQMALESSTGISPFPF